MVPGRLVVVVLVLQSINCAVARNGVLGIDGQQREKSLLQTWGRDLQGAVSTTTGLDTPVTRVVNLLKDMQKTLQNEMTEDAALYDKLACWCNNNQYEKDEAIKDHEAKVESLESSIESLTAKTAGLKGTIKQLEEDTSSDKKALAEATALREKEAVEFHKSEGDDIQAVENLKAAILVLSKHHGGALPQLSFSLLSIRGGSRNGKDSPWAAEHESSLARSFDGFLERNGIAVSEIAPQPKQRLLQQDSSVVANAASLSSDWTADETAVVQRALKSASAFMQARHGEDYYPSYKAKSGEILGLLKELKEQMESDLSAAQKNEQARAATFAELRASKKAEIEAGERQAEKKEDQLAKSSMDLAEAKEDLDQTQATLSEDQRFMVNLKRTCETADKDFEERKTARLSEIKAVTEAMAVLSGDEARDTLSRTYSLVQLSAEARREEDVRARAASALRGVAKKAGNPDLSILATRVELDSFTKVKKAIDDMVKMLKQQQGDEVKKNDWCISEFQVTEATMVKTQTHKAEVSAKIDDLGSTIGRLTDEVKQAKAQVSQMQLELQRATENRQKENLDFQRTVADQRTTQAVLKQALEKLAKYYDQEGLLQTRARGHGAHKANVAARQTPPTAQMKYTPNSGAEAVMSLIEKLIVEAKQLEKDSIESESTAQSQYESLVADTNASVSALQKQIAGKTSEKAVTKKDKLVAENELVATKKDLDGLDKYTADLHGDCDYIVKNFGTRQEARQQEIQALQQAKQILSGASMY